MANFDYKTRGKSSPQGKPRVYFCCHPNDFAAYFDTVSDEILSKQTCAVWYATETAVRDEAFLADLRQMQLLVMPVTKTLLTTPNEALNIDFAFAVDNHIPVLPLMQEEGLETLFNEKCGDLQFLDKTCTDTTAIAYDEKLQAHLSAVLVGDELAKTIREAFDAYIFLSYRKKDRRHAQELMRLIHNNDFCRDIAIWYDEFLTPGENFNDTIRDALQTSGLFVLAVTPNLINEENYIMTTEYPLAKQAGKPVFPAELIPTDHTVLFEKYENIPTPTDAHNEETFTKALLTTVKTIALKGVEDSPEHRFLIGLAYLNGIDVEVDHARAVSLITASANDGLPAAVKQLVKMHDFGIGVERSYTKKIQYQSQLVELLEADYRRTNDEATFLSLNIELFELGRFCYDEHQTEAANAVWQRAQQLAAENKADNSWRDSTILTAQLQQAVLALSNNNTAEALRLFLEVYEQSYRLAKSENGTMAALCTMLIAGSHCVSIYIDTDDLDNAVAMADYLDGLALSLLPTAAGQQHLYTALANVFKTNGKLFGVIEGYEEAVECYDKALVCAQEAYDLSGSTDALHNIAIVHKDYADFWAKQQATEKAKEHFSKALDICEELSKKEGTYYQQKDVVNINQQLYEIGDSSQKEHHLSAAYTEAKEMCAQRRSSDGVGFHFIQIAKARLEYELTTNRAVPSALLEDIVNTVNSIKILALSDLEFLYDMLNEAGLEADKQNVDHRCYVHCTELAQRLVSMQDSVEHKTALKYAYLNNAVYLFKRMDLENAFGYYMNAAALAQALYADTQDPQHLYDQALCYITVVKFVDPQQQRQMIEIITSIIAFLENHAPGQGGNAAHLKQLLQSIFNT